MVPARLNPSKPTRLLLLCRVTVLCLVSVPLQAQTWVDTWTADNGLPQNSVTALTQTPDGYIWLTTQEGLVRFDRTPSKLGDDGPSAPARGEP